MDIVKPLGLILSVLLALAAGVLTIGGGGDGLWEHDGVVQVAAPREAVFEWLTDPDRRQEWVVGLVDSRVDPPGRLKKGSRLLETIEVDGERRERIVEITDLEAGSVFAYRTSEDGVEIAMRCKVAAQFTGGRSRIDYTCRAQFPGWLAKVIEPILGHQRRSRMEESFARLKAKAAGSI
ncbi:MAG: SRPBCC family protein [Planctomycetota bacterium]